MAELDLFEISTEFLMGSGGRLSGRTLRVLQLSDRAPDADALGGLEIHVADLATHLGSELEPFAAHLRSNHLVVEAFRPARRELALLPAADFHAALSTAILALEIDVLHVHSPVLGPAVLARVLTDADARGVLTLHDVASAEIDLSPLLGAIDAVICPSRFIAELAGASDYRKLRWGVPPQKRVTGSASGRLRVGVVGVLAPDKGLERLPELMRVCGGLGVEWHLFGAAEGRSLRAIRRAASEVHLHGAYRRKELGRLLDEAAIDVALLASIVPESFSMTLSECIAAGVPVVASNIGALGERVREERCGWPFDPSRPASLVTVLEKLTDRREIEETKARLAALPVHTPAEMAAEHAALYLQIARRRSERDESDRLAARRRFDTHRSRGESAWRRIWRSIRHSKRYRDSRLRGLLPETTRAAIERRAASLLDRRRR